MSGPGTVFQIYDKNAERRANQENNRGTNIWYRFEVRLTDEKADQFVSEYILLMDHSSDPAYDLGMLMRKLLGGLVRFVNPKEGTQRKNYKFSPLDSQWSNFFGSEIPVLFHSNKPPDRSLDQKWAWLDESMSALLGSFMIAYPDFQTKFNLLAGKGILRLKPDQKEAINKMLLDRGENVVSDDQFLNLAKSLIEQNQSHDQRIEALKNEDLPY